MPLTLPRIVTFYSFKGGVGRSMALANIAFLLARDYHLSVLAVDWDLEAPGLHRYFDISDTDLEEGVIDYLIQYKKLLREPRSEIKPADLSISPYLRELYSFKNGGSLRFLSAGSMPSKSIYAGKVHGFGWDNFYAEWNGAQVVEGLRNQFLKSAQITLIDSRTGFTDVGGVCTVQLPDTVVFVLVFNEQNFSGITQIAKELSDKNNSTLKALQRNPELLFLPSRKELSEVARLREWESRAVDLFGLYCDSPRIRKDYGSVATYLRKAAVPYVPYFAFGEELAAKTEKGLELAESFMPLTRLLVGEGSRLKRSDTFLAKSMNRLTDAAKKWLWPNVRRVAYLAVLFFLLYFLTQSSGNLECGSPETKGIPAGSSFWIKKATGWRSPATHGVVIVAFTPGIEPANVLEDLCARRLFTAALIQRLNDLGSGVIAIDESFGPLRCDSNAALATAMQTSRVPVIIGRRIQPINQTYKDGQWVCQSEIPSLDLPIPSEHVGAMGLDSDTRRIPLSWPVLQPDQTHVSHMDTFAWVAASVADKESVTTSRITAARANDQHPYSTMVNLPTLSAIRVLCGQTTSANLNWQSCTTKEPLDGLNGAIVVIGDHRESDQHTSDLGIVSAVDLQANYIAALLDQRYYLPTSFLVNTAVMVVFFFLLQMMFLISKSVVRALLYSILLWLLEFMVVIGVLAFAGYLVSPWIQGIVLIAILIVLSEGMYQKIYLKKFPIQA